MSNHTTNPVVAASPPAGSAPDQPASVPVGLASKTGYGVALAGLVGAVLAYLTGDHSQSQLGSIVSASVGVISLAMTQIGRYVQANSQINAYAQIHRVYAEGGTVVRTIEHYDPNASSQVDLLVRDAVREEIGRLHGVPQQAATDLQSILLPTHDEEAADQPPQLHPAGGSTAGG